MPPETMMNRTHRSPTSPGFAEFRDLSQYPNAAYPVLHSINLMSRWNNAGQWTYRQRKSTLQI
jgi:hypothetical protein